MAETTTMPAPPLKARRSALASVWAAGDHGRPLGPFQPGVLITERRGLATVELHARPATAAAVAAAVGAAFVATPSPVAGPAASARGLRILWTGPARWIVLGPDDGDLVARVTAAAGPAGGTVVDQTQGRTILRLEGPNVRDTLAKGCSVDLHPGVFAEDTSVQTGLFHLGVTLDRRAGPHCFDVHVMRGFAVSLYESLVEAAAEYGLRIG